MKKNNNLPPSKNPTMPDEAGIEVDGAYVPNHASASERKVLEDGEEHAGTEEALTLGKPEVPEITDLEALADEDVLPVGIQTGQTARGAYSTDQSTGAGGYRDHRAEQFGTDEVAQPGNDEGREPDALDKGY
ncbi:MAG: hypothetical protein ABI432_13515 [Flavobacteriales bacterium]